MVHGPCLYLFLLLFGITFRQWRQCYGGLEVSEQVRVWSSLSQMLRIAEFTTLGSLAWRIEYLYHLQLHNKYSMNLKLAAKLSGHV